MAGPHFKSHPINSTSDHSAGTAQTLLGTNVAGTTITELPYDNGGSTLAGNVPVRDANGDVQVPATPTTNGAAASKAYVDLAKAGLSLKQSARAATTGVLPANTYANGAAGVGATLTGNVNGALAAQDGVTLVANDRLLVKDEAAGSHNGICVLTQVGSGGTPYILTRATDFNSSTSTPPSITEGSFLLIEEGTTQAGEQWALTTTGAITVGTTALTFTRLFTPTAPTAGDGIAVSGFKVSTAPATAVAEQQYGGVTNRRTSDGSGVASADAGFLAVVTDNTTIDVSATNQLQTKLDKGNGTYAGASPTGTELAAVLASFGQRAYFYSSGSPGTSSVFLAFRRAVTGGNPLTDFAVVELS